MKRQREDPIAHAGGDRAVGGLRGGERGLAGNRHRIVNQGLDAFAGKVRLQLGARGAILREDDKEMIDVAVVDLGQRFDRTSRQRRPLLCARFRATP